jgi:hypothetical protein
MKRKFLLLIFCSSVSTTAFAQVWATATSINKNNGRAIVFRYITEFSPIFDRSSQPDRIILVWKYQSERGMPILAERERMDIMEDILSPILESDGFATLPLVSTGENLREWTYYVKSKEEFVSRLNKALSGKPAFPIEVHSASDPSWSMYEKFRAGMNK